MKHIYAWWPRKPDPGNFGDILTPFLIKELYNYKCVYSSTPFVRPTLLGIGSIISRADRNCTVWGSGLIHSDGPLNPRAKYLCVRGPRTYEKLKELDISCPSIFGDPALLLPQVYKGVKNQIYDFGIFAHYVDTEQVRQWYGNDPNILIIDPLDKNPLRVVDDVLKCKRIISSSLHGIITAHAYGIPAVWVRHSDKLNGDDIKFHDYYESVGLSAGTPVDFFEKISSEDFSKFTYQYDITINMDGVYIALEKHLDACMRGYDEPTDQ
jgi:hypothetical protein